MVVASAHPPPGRAPRPLRARLLGVEDQEALLDFLAAASSENLLLIDAAMNLGGAEGPPIVPPTLYGVFGEAGLEGAASVRPSIVFSSGISRPVIDVLLPVLRRVSSGLLKCESACVDEVWPAFEARGRRTMIDRIEIAYRLGRAGLQRAEPDLPGVARPARYEDLDDLVYAARASLWEEDRPDPADGDPEGFRRWVAGRLPRARVVTEKGKLVFVSYADVRRESGWLIQGVYTWPAARRRGFARRGMDSILREAFASGASHVQLAVVEGNERATSLYEDLGFEAFARLRTILFR